MSKLIESNPYYYFNSSHRNAWAKGFEAGQKALLTPAPLSITGRWWLSEMGSIMFVKPIQYEDFQCAADNNPCGCRWLTEETTIEFAAEQTPSFANAQQPRALTPVSVTGRWWQFGDGKICLLMNINIINR